MNESATPRSRPDGPDTLPAVEISSDEIALWLKGLNLLSKIEEASIQMALQKIIPGYKKMAHYRLPTEAEWEFVARNDGLANGDFSFGTNGYPENTDIDDYAFHYKNSDVKLQPVGQKRPMMYYGKPIYDLHGNTSQLTSDFFQEDFSGGTDPTGPSSGTAHVKISSLACAFQVKLCFDLNLVCCLAYS